MALRGQDAYQLAGLLSQLPTLSGRPNAVGGMAPALLQMGQQARQEEQRKQATEKFQGLLGQRAQVNPYQQSEAEMFPGEQPMQGLHDIQPGSGLLGGEIGQEEFYGGLLGTPGYEQIGARGLMMAGGLAGGDAPASVREFNYYQGLSPDEQRQFQTLRRGSQFQDLGSEIVQYGPDGSITARYPKDLAPSQRPEVQGQQEAAKVTGRADAEAAANWSKVNDAYNQFVTQSENVTSAIDDAIARAGTFTTGPTGKIGQLIPGTPQYDYARLLDTIKANIGFDKLQQMRDASPTGGALGQVSEMENRLLQAVQGSTDIGQSPEQLRKNLQNIKRFYSEVLEERANAFERDRAKFGGGEPTMADTPASQPSVQPSPKRMRYNPATGQLEPVNG